jgi:hypothetical protein
VAPVVEEVAKAIPLLLVGVFLGARRQWGLADFAVLGAAVGSGMGLLETLMNNPPDPVALTPLPDGGWMGQPGLSLNAVYFPGVEQVLTGWLPASVGVVEVGDWDGALTSIRHVSWGVLDGLAVGLLLRGRGWTRAISLVPLVAAVGHHWAVNNGYGWVGEADGWLRPVATGGLVVAMVVDWRQLRWGKATVPDVLLPAEHASRVGGLMAVANRFLPYTALAVARFARARRQLLYAAARTRSEALHTIEPLLVAVAQTAALLDHAHRHGRWDATRIRAALRTARPSRPRRWPLLAVPVLLAVPSLLYMGVGNFPSTHAVGEWFTRSPGTEVLFACAVASLVFTLVMTVLLIRSWRATRNQPLAEPAAVLVFRLITATGALATGGWLIYLRLAGTPLDEEVIDTDRASLLMALDNLQFALGLALLLIGMFTLFTPAGASLALAGGGVAWLCSRERTALRQRCGRRPWGRKQCGCAREREARGILRRGQRHVAMVNPIKVGGTQA